MPESTAATDFAQCRIRPATREDLPAAAPVYRHADLVDAGQPDGSPDAATVDSAVLEDLSLLLESFPGSVWVAECSGGIAGIAAAAIRPPHWHLTYFFVEPNWQDRGIGRRLLDACREAGRRAGCTRISTEPSTDRRALAAYLRLGMIPSLPALGFEIEQLSAPPRAGDDGLADHPVLGPDDPGMAGIGAIDADVRGARREIDHRRWLAGGGSLSLLLDAATGEPAGYVAFRPQEGFWRLGPVAAVDAVRFAAVLDRALELAARRGAPDARWRVIVPAANSAAMNVLPSRGFQPALLFPIMQNGPIGQWDRYLFADFDVM